ncbi:MAG: hypothetical protein GY751_06680 [Bacteroidetes bacterium]|nr:hypothetical protein [Bacteroidota bacterium]
MQQHLVVWGDIGTDHKALIAIKMDTELNQVIYRAFPEEDVTKELQDQLFTVWKNGGEFIFPEDVPTWTVDASEDNILPSEIRLHKPGMLVTAQRHWSKKVVLDSTFKLESDKLHVLELEMDSLQHYEQSLWDKTRSLWEEILELRKKDDLSWQNADELKLRINLIFDALKAFKRLNQEKNYDESLALFKLFGKRADECLEQLIYPDEWGRIANSMKGLQRELREAPLVMKHRRAIERKINAVFNDLRKYRKSDQINHLQDRIQGLNRVLRALKGAIERDSDSYKIQFEKLKHYTRGKLSDDEIREQLGSEKGRTSDKEKKIKSITKTIRSLEAKIENLKKPEPSRKKKKARKPKPDSAKNTESTAATEQEGKSGKPKPKRKRVEAKAADNLPEDTPPATEPVVEPIAAAAIIAENIPADVVDDTKDVSDAPAAEKAKDEPTDAVEEVKAKEQEEQPAEEAAVAKEVPVEEAPAPSAVKESAETMELLAIAKEPETTEETGADAIDTTTEIPDTAVMEEVKEAVPPPEVVEKVKTAEPEAPTVEAAVPEEVPVEETPAPSIEKESPEAAEQSPIVEEPETAAKTKPDAVDAVENKTPSEEALAAETGSDEPKTDKTEAEA